MESIFQIDEAEASRKTYRVHLPGAENDLYSLLGLRELALKKVITSRTPISKEGENVETPARSIPSVFSHRSTRVALALWFIGLERLYLGDSKGHVIRIALLIPLWFAVSLNVEFWTKLPDGDSYAEVIERGFWLFGGVPVLLAASALALITTVTSARNWLKSGNELTNGTAVDRQGRPLLD